MDLIRTPNDGLPVIRAYGAGGFRIATERYDGTVLVGAHGVRTLAVTTLDDIDAALARDIVGLAPPPAILLIGTGVEMTVLEGEARDILRAAGIAVECLGTGAACRTFNVALAEGRSVAALLLPVD